MKLDQLVEVLQGAGAAHHVVRRGQGGYVVFPQGARVLGAWPDGQDENIFWTADRCQSGRTLAEALQAKEWNYGGDRLWFSPELNLFVRRPLATDPEYVPPSIDPGDYDLRVEGDTVHMRQSGTLRDGREGVDIRFEASRTVRPVEAPLAKLSEVAYVGYEFVSRIEAGTDGGAAPRVNLWQLAMVPPTGEILIPTWRKAKPYDFFSTGTKKWCKVKSECVVFPVTGDRRHKIGVNASVVCGRIGYLRRLGKKRWSLLVRNMQPVPGAYYPDYPIADPSRRCFAVQCYNDGGQFGGFGEVEHHAPAVVTGKNTCTSMDVSHLWAFVGPPAVIRRVAAELLGPSGTSWK